MKAESASNIADLNLTISKPMIKGGKMVREK